ncbi:MAG TPA: RNA polymerase sigma factor [Anaerolineae bacterium]|nr:RNA polymerase sigma factor [Anaerolineae bacterium]
MDPELVIMAQHGDQQAFETLATIAHPRLYRVALGVLGDAGAADDATQQALVAVWRDLPRLRDPKRFGGWSYRLLVRACYAEAKRRPAWLPESAIDGSHEPVAADDFRGVLERDQLERGLRRLSAEHRAAIVLRYMLDLPLDQVAGALDVSVGTVNSRLNRALKALRAALDADARRVSPITAPRTSS